MSSLKRKAKSQLRRQLLSWHKRLGIFSAIFVLLLSVTGIMLNHTSELGLGSKTPPSMLLPFYGVEQPTIVAAPIAEHWLLHAKSRLYLSVGAITVERTEKENTKRNSEVLAETLMVPWSACGFLLGSIDFSAYSVIVCNDSLHLATPEAELVESVEWPLGNDKLIETAAKCDDKLCLNSPSGLVVYDLDDLEYRSVDDSKGVGLTWVKSLPAPQDLEQVWLANYQGGDISWERLILDVHAGRFLGGIGPLFMDLVAIIFIILALTGTYLWLKQGRSRS